MSSCASLKRLRSGEAAGVASSLAAPPPPGSLAREPVASPHLAPVFVVATGALESALMDTGEWGSAAAASRLAAELGVLQADRVVAAQLATGVARFESHRADWGTRLAEVRVRVQVGSLRFTDRVLLDVGQPAHSARLAEQYAAQTVADLGLWCATGPGPPRAGPGSLPL